MSLPPHSPSFIAFTSVFFLFPAWTLLHLSVCQLRLFRWASKVSPLLPAFLPSPPCPPVTRWSVCHYFYPQRMPRSQSTMFCRPSPPGTPRNTPPASGSVRTNNGSCGMKLTPPPPLSPHGVSVLLLLCDSSSMMTEEGGDPATYPLCSQSLDFLFSVSVL